MIIKSQLPRESEICKIVKAPEITFRAAIQRHTKKVLFNSSFLLFFLSLEDEAPSFRSSALARVVDRARFLLRSVTRQEGTSSCRRRVRESGQLRPGSRATTSADFHCGGRRCVHDAFVRAHAYAYARVQGEIIERFRVLSRSSVQQARPVYRSVRLPRRRAYHARSPRATKPRTDRELGEIITIRRLLVFFYISANKERNQKWKCAFEMRFVAKKSFVSVLLRSSNSIDTS